MRMLRTSQPGGCVAQLASAEHRRQLAQLVAAALPLTSRHHLAHFGRAAGLDGAERITGRSVLDRAQPVAGMLPRAGDQLGQRGGRILAPAAA